MFRKLLLVSLGWMLLLAPAAAAGNAEDYGAPFLNFELLGNNQVRIFGSGCQPGEAVAIQYSDKTVDTTADANGDFSVVIDVTGLSGDLTVTSTCGDLVQSIVVPLGSGAPLPRTGDDSSLPLARFGAILVALGGAALYVSQKRSRAATNAPSAV